MIRVRTIGQQQFRADCGRLWDLASADFRPQLVIGIRSGGWWVAEAMMAARQPAEVTFLPLTCRRPTSDLKGRSGTFKFALKRLPYFVLNFLRTLEYYTLTLPRCRAVRRQGAGAMRVPDGRELTAIQSAVAQRPESVRALVVDDSLDSGATVAAVIGELRRLLPPRAEIRTAAITVLGPYPIVAADYSLYQRVNCRFPWSFDFQG